MNDFDEKIIAMWSKTTQNYRQTYCFIHLQRNVKKRTLSKDVKSQILEDIDYLAESTSSDEFDKRWEITKKSWQDKKKEDVTAFLTYFEEQYIKKHRNWFLGVCPVGLGNSNNAIEGFNCSFKRQFTNYERQDIVIIPIIILINFYRASS